MRSAAFSWAPPGTGWSTSRGSSRWRTAPAARLSRHLPAGGDVLDIVGYFHSHPDHPARPSETDRRIAAEGLSDGVVHIVCGVAGGRDTVATAWIFRDAPQAFEEEPFQNE